MPGWHIDSNNNASKMAVSDIDILRRGVAKKKNFVAMRSFGLFGADAAVPSTMRLQTRAAAD